MRERMAGGPNMSVLDDDRIGRLLVKLTLPAFMGKRTISSMWMCLAQRAHSNSTGSM